MRKGTKHKKDRAACKCLMIEVPKGIGLFEKEKKTGLVFFSVFTEICFINAKVVETKS